MLKNQLTVEETLVDAGGGLQFGDPKTNRTMVWDNECRMVDDPEGEARKILLA